MRIVAYRLSYVVRASLVILVCALVALPGAIGAQVAPGTLVGRALLAAATLADGPRAGQSFASRKTINGVKVPFDSQPVGGFVDMSPGPYAGAFWVLINVSFGTAANSAYYLLCSSPFVLT